MLNASSNDAAISFSGLQIDPPVLMVSPEAEYAAIFSCNGAMLLLQSYSGRCIRVGPVRSLRGEDPVDATITRLLHKGYQVQDLDQDNLLDFVDKYMAAAGFTAGHIRASLSLYRS